MKPAKPRYQQLKDDIIELISSGTLLPADRVPSENELVESKNVSRMTANRALRELTSEGYVERVAGAGTFVSDYRARSDVLEVRNIADEIAARGHRHSATVLRQRCSRAADDVARALQIAAGDDVFELCLVHAENEVPVQLEQRYVRTDFAPECLRQDFTTVTPSAYLTGIAPMQEAEHAVRASMPAADIKKCLDMAEHEPCLLLVRRTWSNGRPVTYAHLYHPGSRYELTGKFSARGKDAPASADVKL